MYDRFDLCTGGPKCEKHSLSVPHGRMRGGGFESPLVVSLELGDALVAKAMKRGKIAESTGDTLKEKFRELGLCETTLEAFHRSKEEYPEGEMCKALTNDFDLALAAAALNKVTLDYWLEKEIPEGKSDREEQKGSPTGGKEQVRRKFPPGAVKVEACNDPRCKYPNSPHIFFSVGENDFGPFFSMRQLEDALAEGQLEGFFGEDDAELVRKGVLPFHLPPTHPTDQLDDT